MKKIISYLIDVISVLVLLCAVFLFLTVLLTRSGKVPDVGGYSALRVLTGSMEPAIPEDTLVITRKTDAEGIQVGDVITFFSSDPNLGGFVNTHRVEEKQKLGDEWVFTTKGDANSIVDAYPVTEDQLIGKVIYTNQTLGKLSRLISNPLVYFPLIVGPLVLIAVVSFAGIITSAREIMREEEDELIRKAIEDVRRRHEESDEEHHNETVEDEK